MPHHGNEAEHAGEGRDENQKPVIHDNRKVDPKTGQARHPDQEPA
ncbi:MAG TPA: nucleotide exchange factor GrpE, partial [Arthrobacter sp.]|nr:nucleotide exchange factor GrpE [Arthrobacter sp.]